MARKPFIIIRNPKSHYLYVQFWDEESGAYTPRKSLRTKKKGEALSAAIDLLASGGPRQTPLVVEYLSGFWALNGEYVQACRARGRSISDRYARENDKRLERMVIPLVRSICGPRMTMDRVKPAHLERILMKLHATCLTARTANTYFQALQVPFARAHRLGVIDTNPAEKVAKLAEEKTARGILTPEETREFFRGDWADRRAFAANLLAATAGLRLGEVLGLLIDRVHDGWIEVRGNWQYGEGLKEPKWGSIREVPIPSVTEQAIRDLVKENPWGGPFVFYGARPDHPTHDAVVRNAFNSRLEQMGISTAVREKRNITFHSWRHFYNSMLRGRPGIPDHVLRQLTGHKSEAMTDRYTHVTEEQRAAVAALAEGIF